MKKNNKFIIITILVLLFNSLVFAKPKVALVLSGGGAKGLAEIPLIEVLEEEGIHPDMVLGTSMGSLLGALYAAGYTPKEVKDTMLGLDFVEILNDVPVYREKLAPEAFSVRTDNHAALPFNENGIGSVPGILGDQNILVTLTGLLSRVLTISDFDKFPVPYRAVAVDLCTGEPIVFDSGSIITAARSSMSLPAIWTPAVVGDGRICLDGGFRDNMPIRVARELGADFVIAMDVINETKCNAEDLVDFTSVSMQIFNVVMPNTSLDQHVLADMVFCPDLEPFSLMGFTQAQQIYEAGVKCVADRREELHKLVQKMEKMGVELRFDDPERKGVYDKLPDPVIESVKIKNVSFVKEAVLPDADEFEVVIGKKLDDETKEFLRDRLEEVRKNYHFTSLVYFSRPGKNENSVILEIQANTYKQDFNKIFLGGNNTVSFSHKEDVDHAEFHVMPDFTIGTYIAHPVEMLSHLSFGNTIQLDYSVMPGFSILNNNMKFNMDIGGGLRYGSLEPKTNITYEDRVLNEDKGAFFNTGFLFRYSDRASLKTGAEYEMDYIHSSEIYYHLVNFYFNGAYNSLGSILTDLRGIKAEFALEYSMMMNDFNDDEKYIDALYSVHGAVSQRFEVVRHWTGLGYDLNVSINHMPFELNKGYNEFGGIEGMCGFAYGTLKRDFAVAGLTYQQKLLSVAGMPIMLIAQGKCAIKDDYNPFLDSGDPDNMVFDGVDSVDFGAGIYGALKTPGGNLIVGGSFNRHGQWCVSIGFN